MKKILPALTMLLVCLAVPVHAAVTPVPAGDGVTTVGAVRGITNNNFALLQAQLATQWEPGREYTADDNIVVHGGNLFTAVITHTADTATEPGVGEDWATVWSYTGVALFEPLKGADDNFVTDAEKTAIGNLPADTTSSLAAKQDDLDVPDQTEAEAGTATIERVWTALRIAQAIAALAPQGADEIVYQADCAGISNGFCIDTDDGALYIYNNSAVQRVTVALDLASPGTIGATTPGAGYFTYISTASMDISPPPPGSTGEIAIHEDPDSDGSDMIGWKAPTDVNVGTEQLGDLLWMLPGDEGTAGQTMVTDGNMVLSWRLVITDAERTKLEGIEDGADVTDADNVNAVEADPITGAITGIVKADGGGNISVAVPDTDYQSVPAEGAFVDGDKTKLDGIAAGATANDTDANLLDRANHTGTQAAATISDFDTEVSNNSTVVANSAALPVAAPTTAADVCSAGTWGFDTSYIYICVATDTWLRAAIATW